ncbi:MAG: chemotaxis protein CheB [Pseudoxanthomonas sp.]
MPATETKAAKSVVLLAREGLARDNLRQALAEADARIVLEADPTVVDVLALQSAQAAAVLVVLDPTLEDGLSRLDEVLHDPDVNVIYEDAELAASRSGWDAQRWVRHLSAKLHGHRDVLPPGRESDGLTDTPLQPNRWVTPAELHAGQRLQPHLDEARDLAQSLPQASPVLTDQEDSLSLVEDSGITVSFADSGLSLTDDSGLSLVLDEEPLPADDTPVSLFQADEPEAWEPPAQPLDAALVEGFGVSATMPAEDKLEPAPAVAEPPPLSEEMPVPMPAPKTEWKLELEALSDTPMDCEPTATGEVVVGAVLLLAGIGGPDAVRRVLTELPADFPMPLLLSLRLDGGRYVNLVKQLQRVSPMPVSLARAGDAALASRVYVLPDDVATIVENGKVRFDEGETNVEALIAALPAQSAVLLLSGSDPACVDAAVALAAKGGYAGGQSPQGCYDPAAAKALQARGGTVGEPAGLAAALVQRT